MDAQLASPLKDIKKLTYPVGVEPKLDGVRTNAIMSSHGVALAKLVSRQGKPLDNFVEIEDLLGMAVAHGFVIDGEVDSPDGFKALMHRAKAKRGVATEIPIRFTVWDILTVDEWQKGESLLSQAARSQQVQNFVLDIHQNFPHLSHLIRAIEQVIVNNETELLAATIRHVAEGYEGSIIKKLDQKYRAKRNQNWLKYKAVLSADLAVVGMEELMLKGHFKQDGTLITEEDYAEHENDRLSRKEIRERIFGVTAETTEERPAGIMGSVHCEGIYDGRLIKSKVGSGFSNEWRRWFWENRATILDRKDLVVEVQFQEISQADGNEHFSLRFPTFLRLREDKTEAVGA